MNGSPTKTATIDTALDIVKADIDWYDAITKGFSNDPNGDSANTHLHFPLYGEEAGLRTIRKSPYNEASSNTFAKAG
jgi:hypothetical protein